MRGNVTVPSQVLGGKSFRLLSLLVTLLKLWLLSFLLEIILRIIVRCKGFQRLNLIYLLHCYCVMNFNYLGL